MNLHRLLILLLLSPMLALAEPPLPGGLQTEKPEPPALPGGLGEPPLPTISASTKLEKEDEVNALSAFSTYGFAETRAGSRLHDDPRQRDTSIMEGRLQLSLDYTTEALTANLTTDILLDDIDDSDSISLNRGRGEIDLREAWLQKMLGENIDIKLGRQIMTWGTGDMLFINDLFPKDWNSFFIGRDSEYLKAPSDAVKASVFFEAFNLDLVWTPQFDPDRFIDGRRISYFDPLTGSLSGRELPLEPDIPQGDEYALRLYKTFQGVEYALYGYCGYWKSPGGFDPDTVKPAFPRLNATGASMRGNIAGGIGNIELGYYDSKDDSKGDNPFVNNSELRLLLGYERELIPDLTGAIQFYIERIQDYGAYRDTLPAGQPSRDRTRQVITTRLTWLTLNQNLTWSLFAYMSPTDQDIYARPKVSWKASDQLLIEGGMNLFGGADQRTFFGQFEDTSNAYIAVRYDFI